MEPRRLSRIGSYVGVQPNTEGGFVDGSGREPNNGLRGIFFGGRKTITVHFQEEHAHYKAGAFVTVDKGGGCAMPTM